MFLQKQVGWDKCVACSDSRLKPGYQWVFTHWIVCPACNGTAQTPRYKLFDPRTGEEIDYEAPPVSAGLILPQGVANG